MLIENTGFKKPMNDIVEEIISSNQTIFKFKKEPIGLKEKSKLYRITPYIPTVELISHEMSEIKEILINISDNIGLGEVSLKNNKCSIYPPTFYIKGNPELSAEEMIVLDDKLMEQLHRVLKKEDKLDYFKKFFVELDFF